MVCQPISSAVRFHWHCYSDCHASASPGANLLWGGMAFHPHSSSYILLHYLIVNSFLLSFGPYCRLVLCVPSSKLTKIVRNDVVKHPENPSNPWQIRRRPSSTDLKDMISSVKRRLPYVLVGSATNRTWFSEGWSCLLPTHGFDIPLIWWIRNDH